MDGTGGRAAGSGTQLRGAAAALRRAQAPAGERASGGRRLALRSTRARILAGFALLTALSTAGSLLLVKQILDTRLGEGIARQLTQEVAEFDRLAGGIDPRTGKAFTDKRRVLDVYFARNVPDEGEVVLSSASGRLYRSIRAGDGAYRPVEILRAIARRGPLDSAHQGTVTTAAGTARYVNVPLEGRGRGRAATAFAVAIFPGNEQREIDEALMTAAQVSALMFAMAFIAAWAGAGRVLAPLRELRDMTQAITESDFTRRISLRGRDEVAQLAERFNEMLDRLDAAFGTQRRFVDDAGHELRTPITIVRGHLELLSDDPDDRRETVALVLDELDRMSRTVNDLILLANAEKPDFLRPAPFDLGALTKELHAKVTALAPRSWRIESTGGGTIVADRQRLTQALVQLAANAVEHTGTDDVIELGAVVGAGYARLSVRDTGRGIPYAEQPLVFGRFVRGSGKVRADGAGLGLSIVDAIARAHGGRVELSSRPGHGAKFTVVVPVAAAALRT